MIRVDRMGVDAGEFRLDGISFEVPAGACTAMMGASASGKTTILETICGLRRMRTGSITIDGVPVHTLDPAARRIGYVPQDGALFLTMTIRQQMELPLRARRWARGDRGRRCDEIAEMLALEHLLDRRPDGLSGGERQRAALARAVAFPPAVLCLDEPFNALDDGSRDSMYDAIDGIRERTNVAMVLVTHSRAEADRLADEVLMLDPDGTTRVGGVPMAP